MTDPSISTQQQRHNQQQAESAQGCRAEEASTENRGGMYLISSTVFQTENLLTCSNKAYRMRPMPNDGSTTEGIIFWPLTFCCFFSKATMSFVKAYFVFPKLISSWFLQEVIKHWQRKVTQDDWLGSCYIARPLRSPKKPSASEWPALPFYRSFRWGPCWVWPLQYRQFSSFHQYNYWRANALTGSGKVS